MDADQKESLKQKLVDKLRATGHVAEEGLDMVAAATIELLWVAAESAENKS